MTIKRKTGKSVPAGSWPVAEQAAAWFLVFDEGEPDQATRREFVVWMKQSPTHIEEFVQISALHLEIAQASQKTAARETPWLHFGHCLSSTRPHFSQKFAPWRFLCWQAGQTTAPLNFKG